MTASGTWLKVPNVLAAELNCADFASVLKYAAFCTRAYAKNFEGEDQSDTTAKRGNIRAHATRLERLSKSIARREVHRKARLVRR